MNEQTAISDQCREKDKHAKEPDPKRDRQHFSGDLNLAKERAACPHGRFWNMEKAKKKSAHGPQSQDGKGDQDQRPQRG